MKQSDDRARWLGVWAVMLAAQVCLRGGQGVIGVGLLVAGFLGVRGHDLHETQRGKIPKAWWLAGGALVLVALALRLWRLESVPPIWWDEGVEGHDARSVAAGLPLEPLDGIYYHRGPIWLALLAAMGSVAGFSLFALRAVAAVAGTLLVALGGFIAARLFGGWVGLFAGGWLAFHMWPLNMSRIMIGNILVPLAAVAIVWVAGQARWSWRRRGAVAGILSGVSQYGYVAALQLPALAAVALWLLAPRRPERPQGAEGSAPIRAWRFDRWKAVGLAVGITVLCIAPYRLVYGGLWDKAANVSVLSDPAMVVRNIMATLPMFHAHGDDDLRHQYPASVPVLNTVLAACFSIGISLAAWNLRQSRWLLLLLWLGLGLSPGLASAGGERNLFRMIGAIPPVAILCAIGAATLPRAFGDRLGRGVAAALWLGSVLVGLRTYFLVFPFDRVTGVWYRTYDLDAARELKARAAQRPLQLRAPLTLTQHPLARLLLFSEIRTGRVAPWVPHRPSQDQGLHVSKTFQDSYGVPQAVLLVGAVPEHGKAPWPVALHTVLAVGEAGDTLARAGRTREAVAHYRRFVALIPRSPMLQERLGFAALKAGEWETARTAFSRAITLGSRFAATYDGWGQALYRLGRRAEAEAALREAMRLGGSPEIQADLDRVRNSRTDRMNGDQ